MFIRPLQTQFGWSVPEVALAYALICLVFGLVSIPAGRLADRFGPRIIVLIGSILMALGFFLVSTIAPPTPEALASGAKATTQLYLLYLYYGIIAGVGGGMVYLPPISTAPKWWPDRKALATGLTVVGLGLGSFIMAPLATRMINSFGSALPVFRYVGIAMGILGVIAAFCMKSPPEGYKPAGWRPPAPKEGTETKEYRDHTHGEAIRTPQFWLLWLAYFCGSFAGLMVIGLVAKHGIDAMTVAYRAQAGLAATAPIPDDVGKTIATAAAGAPSTLAIFNALVRVLIGPIADKVGTKVLFVVLFALQAVAMVALYPAGSSAVLLSAVAALIGWNYGAMFTLFPAASLNYYGSKAQASNYGLLFSAWGVAGFAGNFVGGWLQAATGSFLVSFLVAAALLAVAVVILALIRPPVRHHV